MSLHAEFMAAVETAATEQRCHRGLAHAPHDTVDGHCPGRPCPAPPTSEYRRAREESTR